MNAMPASAITRPTSAGRCREMRAGGDLGHNAAECRVAGLAQHRLGQHAAVRVEHGGRRLVAGCFNPEERPI